MITAATSDAATVVIAPVDERTHDLARAVK